MFSYAAPDSSHETPFSSSSSPACALVTGEKLTFSEVSDDLITTKPKGQSNFHPHLSSPSLQNLSHSTISCFSKYFPISAPDFYLAVSFSSSSAIYLLQSFIFIMQSKSSKVYNSLHFSPESRYLNLNLKGVHHLHHLHRVRLRFAISQQTIHHHCLWSLSFHMPPQRCTTLAGFQGHSPKITYFQQVTKSFNFRQTQEVIYTHTSSIFSLIHSPCQDKSFSFFNGYASL